jgi:hypothetical protein
VIGNYQSILEDYLLVEEAVRSLPDERFRLETQAEISERRLAVLNGLRMDASFKLLARIEADLRRDFQRSAVGGASDSISRSFAELARQSGSRVAEIGPRRLLRFLASLFGGDSSRFDERCLLVAGYWDFRDWYAHGRFVERPVDVPEPSILAEIGSELEERVFSRARSRG